MGLMLASLPLPIAILAIGGGVLLTLALITPLVALVALLVLSPLRTLVLTETTFVFDVGQIALAGFLGIWFMRSMTAKRSFLIIRRSSPLWVYLGGFILITGLTGLTAVSVGAWLTEWLKWIIIAGIALLVSSMRNWRWVLFALITSGIGHALVGLYTFVGGSGADHLVINNRFFRAFGTFGQPNPFGGMMGLIAPIALMAGIGYVWRFATTHTHRRTRTDLLIGVYYLAGAGLMTLALFGSWSRGAWLGFSLACCVMLFFLPRGWMMRLLVVFGLSLIGFGLWQSGTLPATITDRVQSATQELFTLSDVRGVDITTDNYAIVERLAHWQAALNMAQHYPAFGVGFGNYDAAYHDNRLINWDLSLGHAHNYYLNVMGEAGIMGVSFYLVLLLGLFVMTIRVLQHPDPVARGTAIGLLGTWVYLSTHSLTDNLYVNNIFIHFGIMLGILVCLHYQVSGQVKSSYYDANLHNRR